MRRGLLLLLLGLAGGAAAQVLVHLAQGGLSERASICLGLYVISFLALHIWLGGRGDPVVVPVLAILCGLGLAEIWRLDPGRGWQQGLWLVIGVLVFAFASRFRNWNGMADLKYIWAVAAAILLVVTIIFGSEVGGARAWLRFAGLSFQASEVAKLLVVASLASHLAESKEFLAVPSRRLGFLRIPSARHLGPLLMMWALFMIMFVFQRDLGGALLLFGVFVFMLYAASNRGVYLSVGALLVVIGGALACAVIDHVRIRFVVWLDPWRYYSGRGYQIVQGLFALGNGGIIGTGLGMGYPYLVPAAANDYIFNALAEELGFMGAVFILAMFMVLVARGFTWAAAQVNEVAALAGTGLSILLGLQTLLIIGGVTRLIPVTGVTLPFLSYGGSSLVTSFAQVGLLYSLSASAYARQRALEV